MQIVRFFKTNWFVISLLLIVVVAFARKNLRFSGGGASVPSHKEQPVKNPEKYTDEGSRGESASIMGLKPGGEARMLAMPSVDEETAMAFFRRFGKVAVEEQKKYGIPASVVLASAYVNSFAGKRDLSKEANNYFALPCSLEWSGRTASAQGRCYRRYETAWESFRDFSLWLSGQAWFREAKKSARQNPQKWAEVLQGQGFSDVENFGAEMMRAVQAYRLFELDSK